MKVPTWTPCPDWYPSPWFIRQVRLFDAKDIPDAVDSEILRLARDDDRKHRGKDALPIPFTGVLAQIQAAARIGELATADEAALIADLKERIDTAVCEAQDIPGNRITPDERDGFIRDFYRKTATIEREVARGAMTRDEAARQYAEAGDSMAFNLAEAEERYQRRKADERRRKADERRAAFLEGVPLGENDPAAFCPDRLATCPRVHAAALRAVLNPCDGSPCWHYWHGESGTGKTWTAVIAGSRLLDECPLSTVRFLSGARLKDDLADRRDANEKTEFIESFADADLLIIDDLFHSVSVPFLEGFRRILVERGDMPTIFTSNYSLPDLIDRASEGEFYQVTNAVVRRIDDRASIVEFSAESEATKGGES